jgi:hypothetical protein
MKKSEMRKNPTVSLCYWIQTPVNRRVFLYQLQICVEVLKHFIAFLRIHTSINFYNLGEVISETLVKKR